VLLFFVSAGLSHPPFLSSSFDPERRKKKRKPQDEEEEGGQRSAFHSMTFQRRPKVYTHKSEIVPHTHRQNTPQEKDELPADQSVRIKMVGEKKNRHSRLSLNC
jgi:hypothetical protein